MSCTSKCRIFIVRREASRTTAKASGARSFRASPFFRRSRNSSVLAPQGVVAQRLQRGFQGSGLAHRRFIAFDDAVIAAAEKPRQEIEHLGILERNFNADSYLGSWPFAGPVFYG